MKSVAVALSLAACAFAQRLHVVSPTSGQTLKPGEFFTMELLQDQSLGPLEQTSIVVASTQCFNACDKPDQWGPGTVLYNGIFVPQGNQTDPSKGHVQDFRFQLPQSQSGSVVLSVAHKYKIGGAKLQDVFDYTTVQINAQ